MFPEWFSVFLGRCRKVLGGGGVGVGMGGAGAVLE